MPPGFDFICPVASRLDGEGAVLHCESCREDVHDLSESTRQEAVALLASAEAPCVRLTVERGRARFRSARSVGRLARLGALAGALAGCAADAAPDGPVASEVMIAAAERLDGLIAEAEADARAAVARAQAKAREAEAAAREAEEAKRRAETRAQEEAEAAEKACAEAKAKARKEARRAREWERSHRTGGALPLERRTVRRPRVRSLFEKL